MDNPLINEATIRACLLGRIGPERETSAQIDERMLADPEFSLLIDVIEDEILEEYVDGVLTAADIEAVENHFLTPPERQRKLRRMRLISRHVTDLAEENKEEAEARPQAGSPKRARVLTFPRTRIWAEVAAALALVSGTIYFWDQQRELRAAVNESRQEAALLKQAQARTPQVTNAGVVSLNLLVPGLSRGNQDLKQVHLTPNDETLQLAIPLSVRPKGRLSAQLKQRNAVVWSSEGWVARPVEGGAVLKIVLPAAVVPEGTCQLTVHVPDVGDVDYSFNVTKTQ